jgi:hypothetical protein
MRKTITILTLIFLTSLGLQAQRNRSSKVVIQLRGMQQVNVHFAGTPFYQVNDRIIINQVFPGNQPLRVVQNHWRRGRNVGRTVIFQGRLRVPPRSKVIASVGRNGVLRVHNIIPLPVNRGRGYYNNRQGRYHNDRPNRRMNAYDRMLIALDRQRFEQDKFRIARNYVRNNDVYAADVLEIMNRLRFESDRLRLAKMAYRSTINIQDYRIVQRGLRYESSRQQLRQFIRRQNRR